VPLPEHSCFRFFSRRRTLLACALISAAGAAIAGNPAAVHPAEWPAAHWPLPEDHALDARVKALMSRMSVEEKVGQLIQADISSVTPEDVRTYRLGSILAGGNSKPGGGARATAAQWQALADQFYAASMDTTGGHVAIPVLFGIDAVHGHNNTVGATLFPQNVALGATRDVALIRAIGAATAAEVRATGINWTFAPTLAVPQDGRWGRAYEGYSQDPAVVAEYAGAMVEGLQGKVGTHDFLNDDHVVATAKHFLGDGGTKNGKDQGDAEVSEEVLRRVHGAGYPPAIDAGVQTVMASFSSWNGTKMHGNRELLTDVLKGRMQFGGFVVGDWNGHGQVPGCTNDDCAAAINAGVDMLMAPDSWRGLYEHTLAEVRGGKISTARLDDAVSRILKVKLRLGVFESGAPSSLQAAKAVDAIVGSAKHRGIARQAVRESLVLLKNNGALLPLDPRRHILVAGDAADSISRQSGGWTLTWQGVGLTNRDFPGAQSIWSGIQQQVAAAGGTAELSVDGQFKAKPDVAIVVFGEDPYAEFQGDIATLSYRPGDDHDLDLLRRLHKAGVPVVAVFLSGRPLWVNREINASDAFVAAWLPGGEGGGVADVLLRTASGAVADDFRGKLAYAWPRSAVQPPSELLGQGTKAQFAFGFGMTYREPRDLPALSEDSGVKGELVPTGLYFDRGKTVHGYAMSLNGAGGAHVAADTSPAALADKTLSMSSLDYRSQEDARRLLWTDAASILAIDSATPLDLDREANGDVLLVVTLRVAALPTGDLRLGMGTAQVPVGKQLAVLPAGSWQRIGIPLKCFRAGGADMHAIARPFSVGAGKGSDIAIARVGLGTDVDHVIDCVGK